MGIIDFLVTIVLALIMFGIGVSLTLSEIKYIFLNPKALIISLISQMILLPIIAFSIALIFDMPSYIKVGLVILAASPGGSTSGFITFMFKGNTALSIVLTTVNSILALFTIPFIVNFAIRQFEGVDTQFLLPFWDTFGDVFVYTAIPVTLGVLLRQFNKNLAAQITKYVKPVLMILLGIVFTLMFFGTGQVNGLSKAEAINIIPFAILLNVLCLFTGLFIAKLFKLGNKNEITISVESAVHNTTLAFLIAGVLLQNENYGKVALVYALFSFWSALLFCYLIRRFHLSKKSD